MALSSRTLPWGALSLLLGLGVAACIDAPRLSTVESSTLPSAAGPDPRPGDATHFGMVFVPGIAVDIASPSSAWAPVPSNGQDEGDGDGNGNGNGNGNGGKKDAGATPPPPPPPPATPPGAGPTTVHVEVAGFWIDAHEVTVDAFHACVVAGSCAAPADGAGCTTTAHLDAHPVTCVTVEQARAYCVWQKRRLIKNNEWTAAAAGSETRPYPWGTSRPAADRLNACGTECAPRGMYAASDGFPRTAPPGSFPLGRSPDGVDDLAGNVAEWVEAGPVKTVRGGSFEDLDVAAIGSVSTRIVDAAAPSIGFRCAADP